MPKNMKNKKQAQKKQGRKQTNAKKRNGDSRRAFGSRQRISGLAYLDPTGKISPPASDNSLGYFTTINSVLRSSLSNSATLDTYIVLQYTPTELRGFSFINDGTQNMGVLSMPQLSTSPPADIRPLRMCVEINNSMPALTAGGNVSVAMLTQPLDWRTLLDAPGTHVTNAGVTSIANIIAGYSKTQTHNGVNFTNSKKWIFYPVSTIGYHTWSDYGSAAYPAYSGYTAYLQPGSDVSALSTCLIKIAATSTVQNYVITIRTQDACRYYTSSVLGNMQVKQPVASAATMLAIHSDAQANGHVGWDVGSMLDKGSSIIQSAGNFVSNAFNFGRGLNAIKNSLFAAGPLIEDAAPLLLA